MSITKIVIHCSATANGKHLCTATETAAQVIDRWHAGRGFKRNPIHYKKFNPHLKSIGYHFVIDTDGHVETGRAVGEIGAHVKGYNTGSNVCFVVRGSKR